MNIIKPTALKARQNTSPEINAEITSETRARIKQYMGSGQDDITCRLEELDKEWDTERVLETNFSVVVVLSTLLGYGVNRKWFALGGVAAVFLLQHALQGWCPPLPVIRRLGVRTAGEINEEKNALQLLQDTVLH